VAERLLGLLRAARRSGTQLAPSAVTADARLAESLTGIARRALCDWNDRGRPWRASTRLSELNASLESTSLTQRAAFADAQSGRSHPDGVLQAACRGYDRAAETGGPPWLEEYALWVTKAVAVALASLDGCDALVSASANGPDNAYFAAAASLAGVKLSVSDVIAAKRGDQQLSSQCDEAPSATIAWSGLTRDLAAARCAAIGVPVCRTGRTTLGYRGPEPECLVDLIVSHPGTILGTDRRLTAGLDAESMQWCGEPRSSVAGLSLLPVATLPVGVDLPSDGLPSSAGAAREQREQQQQQQHAGEFHRLGYVGRIAPEKSIGLALQAAAIAAKRSFASTKRGIEFVVIGAGQLLQPILARFCARQGLLQPPHGKLTFLGRLSGSALEEAMDSLDVLVFPSLRSETETFGRVPLEAIAAGIPVVAFGTGGSSDFIVNGSTAIVPRTLEVGDVATALEIALDRGTASGLRESAFGVVESHIQARTASRRWLSFLSCAAQTCPQGVGQWVRHQLGSATASSISQLRQHRECVAACLA
jgi:glycosyltransferase involved in cell wall biosynthesis